MSPVNNRQADISHYRLAAAWELTEPLWTSTNLVLQGYVELANGPAICTPKKLRPEPGWSTRPVPARYCVLAAPAPLRYLLIATLKSLHAQSIYGMAGRGG